MVAAESLPNPHESGPFFFYHARSPLSNHYARDFYVKGIRFPHMECFLMYCKAKRFGDEMSAAKILLSSHPQECKRLGRAVRGFDDAVWAPVRCSYAIIGGIQKFAQNLDLLQYLLATGTRELVEASPTDRLWGIGMSADDPRVHQRELWGENLCGRYLMDVRQHFNQARS